jgi:hypothetical protein
MDNTQKYTIEQLGQRVKAKYPQYTQYPDKWVGEQTLINFPEYKRVVIEENVQKPGINFDTSSVVKAADSIINEPLQAKTEDLSLKDIPGELGKTGVNLATFPARVAKQTLVDIPSETIGLIKEAGIGPEGAPKLFAEALAETEIAIGKGAFNALKNFGKFLAGGASKTVKGATGLSIDPDAEKTATLDNVVDTSAKIQEFIVEHPEDVMLILDGVNKSLTAAKNKPITDALKPPVGKTPGGDIGNTMAMYDKLIASKDMTASQVYSNPATKTFRPEIATRIVTDAKDLFRNYGRPELAQRLESTVNLNTLTPQIMKSTVESLIKSSGGVDIVSGTARLSGIPQVAEGVGTGVKNIARAPKVLRDKFVEIKYGNDGVKAIGDLEKSYSKIPLPKNITRGEAETGKSFARFMAEHPNIKLEIGDDLKYNTWQTAQNLRKEAGAEANAVKELLRNRVETVSLDDVFKITKEKLANELIGGERESALRYLDSELSNIRNQYKTVGNNRVSLIDAHDIKQAMWERSPFNPTASRGDKLQSNLDYKIGQSFKKAIEDAVPDVDLKALNSQLGDYYHTIQVLENLHGGAAPKGRLGLDFARVGGAIVGAPGGILTSMFGYMAADKIAKFMVQQGLSQPFRRWAVNKLAETRPTVAEQVFEIIKKEQGEQVARQLLGEPSFVTTPNTQGTPNMRVPGSTSDVGGLRQRIRE